MSPITSKRDTVKRRCFHPSKKQWNAYSRATIPQYLHSILTFIKRANRSRKDLQHYRKLPRKQLRRWFLQDNSLQFGKGNFTPLLGVDLLRAEEKEKQQNHHKFLLNLQLKDFRLVDRRSEVSWPSLVKNGGNNHCGTFCHWGHQYERSDQLFGWRSQGNRYSTQNRSTSSTSVNIKSSRSHSIFHLKYEQLVVNPETK